MSGDRVVEFLEYVTSKQPLTLVTEQGVRIRVIDNGSRLQLAILVDDDTGIKHVRDSWDEVLKWRDALREWQDPVNARERFYEDLASLPGSYADKARRVNERIAEILRQCLEASDSHRERGDPERMTGAIKVRTLIAEADRLLSFCRPRLTEQQKIEILSDACQNIQTGREIFLPDSPIMARDIQDRLRYWRGEKTG